MFLWGWLENPCHSSVCIEVCRQLIKQWKYWHKSVSPLDNGRVHNLILHQSTCNNMVPSHFGNMELGTIDHAIGSDWFWSWCNSLALSACIQTIWNCWWVHIEVWKMSRSSGNYDQPFLSPNSRTISAVHSWTNKGPTLMTRMLSFLQKLRRSRWG